ncbi:hypothetical protein LTR62_002941 [Meristemomyces frigidus]|uniref:Calcineurin-like phosphoesterase domain-containing protein n=1 Tax=Meristemomyces frigidus TaxID=1508187 RepID=A0AAN7TIC9_9PEZI|nr:hypothetical protein LTR62_002941 [Meristemomyces frigidus]
MDFRRQDHDDDHEHEQNPHRWRTNPQGAKAARKPLIEHVTNSWRRDEEIRKQTEKEDYDGDEPGFFDFDNRDSCPNSPARALRSKQCWRMFAVVLLVLVVVWYYWTCHIRPQHEQDWEYKQGFLPAQVRGSYGVAKGGHFDGVRIRDLEGRFLPGGHADPRGLRRLVFVGDVHGCRDELERLLAKVGFDKKRDHLIATGDVVSKGPDSAGVLDLLAHHGAQSVRGNHEDRLLEAWKVLSGSDAAAPSEEATSKGYSKDAALLKHLKPHHMKYLQAMPLILRIPPLPQATATATFSSSSSSSSSSHKKEHHNIAEEILVIHAGLVPHVPLERQDPYFVMNMRTIDHKTHVPSALRETKKGRSKPWIELWNWYNSRLEQGKEVAGFHVWSFREWVARQRETSGGWLEGLSGKKGSRAKEKPKPQVAMYGHDSKMGLQLHRWSKGLDTACVSGGELTALVLDAGGRVEIVQVSCRNYRS